MTLARMRVPVRTPRLHAPVAWLCVVPIVAACGGAPRFDRTVTDAHFCAPPHAWRLGDLGAPSNPAGDRPSEAVAATYSKSNVETARAIGALPLLDRLAKLQMAKASDDELLPVRQEIDDEIAFAELDLESAGAELGCETGRAEHVAIALKDADGDQVRDLTVLSLTVSATAAVVSGILTARNGSAVANGTAGVAGGVIGGGLGVGALLVNHTTRFMHPRNLLRDVWLAPAHTELIPAPVWTYLMSPQFGPGGETAIRDNIVLLWRQSGRLGGDPENPDPALIALYFGEGGDYDADELERRATMLSEVLSSMNLMHQELRELAAEVWRR